MEHPKSFGYDYIKLNLQTILFSNDIENNIKHISEIVLNFIKNNPKLFPDDIENSIVIHTHIGDVVAGINSFEIEKRPFDIPFLKSLLGGLTEPYSNIYVIGKCHFGNGTFDMNKYDECLLLSDKYLNDVINEFKAIHFNSGNPDIDLCFAVKSKLFIQGKGNYSRLILEIRKYLNLKYIETNNNFYY